MAVPRLSNLLLLTVTSQEQSIALGNISCLEVPMLTSSPMPTVLAVWPDDNGDGCVYPLCNDGNCVLNNCHCYASTSFVPTLSVGNTSVAQLCWSYFGNNRNNTNVHLLAEARVCDNDDYSTTPFISETLIRVTKFLVRGIASHLTLPDFSISSNIITHLPDFSM